VLARLDPAFRSPALGVIVLAAAVLAIYYGLVLFPFVIDDAYIVLRYARNLATTGELVYNTGEPITALTSPLHALITAALYALTGEHALQAYKALAVGGVVIGAWGVVRVHREHPATLPLVLVVLLLSPSVALWTFGGLETPLLFAVVAAFAVLAQARLRSERTLDRGTLVALHLLAAAGFLLRHDSVCFFAPALLVCWRYRSDWASVAIAVALAAVPCLAWFGFAWVYYGDLLPTSFYVKTPSYGLRQVLANGLYEATWLTLLGILPFLVAALARRILGRDWHVERSEWILLAGIAGVSIYGLGMAQKHMMFGFRHGMPYLPAAASIVLLELRRWSLSPSMLAGALAGLLVIHAMHMQRILDVSVNGFWRWSDFSEAGARSLTQMVDVWKGAAQDIHEHWARDPARGRGPRIFTYAGGVMPYHVPGSYIFEELVSSRRMRCARPREVEFAADYIHTVRTPQTANSPYYKALVGNPGLELISDRPIQIGRELRRVQVYYNAAPTGLALPARFNDPCLAPP
jgi:arabinofuranosyltransferase